MSELTTLVHELRMIADDDGDWVAGPISAIALREAADAIDALATALEDVLRNAGDTVWVGETETLVDRMVALGIYGHEVYEGARPWEVER